MNRVFRDKFAEAEKFDFLERVDGLGDFFVFYAFPEHFQENRFGIGRWAYLIKITYHNDVYFLDSERNRITLDEFFEACSETAKSQIIFNLDFFR